MMNGRVAEAIGALRELEVGYDLYEATPDDGALLQEQLLRTLALTHGSARLQLADLEHQARVGS